jgi:hypothetical protein
MEKPNTPEEMVARFNEIDGIEANAPSSGRSLVKVMDESAVGAFFAECRENGYSRSSTTRDCLTYTVLDSWVRLE